MRSPRHMLYVILSIHQPPTPPTNANPRCPPTGAPPPMAPVAPEPQPRYRPKGGANGRFPAPKAFRGTPSKGRVWIM